MTSEIGHFAHGWASTPERIAVAAFVTVAFAVMARKLHGVNASGMLAGAAACFLLFAGAGPGGFAALVALFLLTWGSTRVGFRRKQEMGIAERREGRNGWQVGANLGVAALSGCVFSMTGGRAWVVALIAALAEAATDTVASEIGQSGRQSAFLITTWKPVLAGTDGGVTGLGTLAGAIGGLAIAMIARMAGLLSLRQLWIPVTAGFVGMLVDSLLGATLQRRRWLNNEAVNFWGTLVAAGVGYGLSTV